MQGHNPPRLHARAPARHLTKTESLDCLLDGGGFGGQVEQIVQRLRRFCHGPVGGVGAVRAFWSMLVSATVDSTKRAGVDSEEGAQQGRQRWVVGMGKGAR
jgi:hypothetical protein